MNAYGHAGEILTVDLSGGKTHKRPTAVYADRFLGGRGLAAKLYWDMVPAEAKALDPENCLICVSGPTAGFNGIAGNRWQVCAKTPAHEPEAFSNGNMGGKWGTALKFAGYDALTVQGKSEKPVYLFIHDGTVEIKDASHLWGRTTFDTQDIRRNELGKGVSVLTIGPAAENLVSFATLLSDENASGSRGLSCDRRPTPVPRHGLWKALPMRRIAGAAASVAHDKCIKEKNPGATKPFASQATYTRGPPWSTTGSGTRPNFSPSGSEMPTDWIQA